APIPLMGLQSNDLPPERDLGKKSSPVFNATAKIPSEEIGSKGIPPERTQQDDIVHAIASAMLPTESILPVIPHTPPHPTNADVADFPKENTKTTIPYYSDYFDPPSPVREILRFEAQGQVITFTDAVSRYFLEAIGEPLPGGTVTTSIPKDFDRKYMEFLRAVKAHSGKIYDAGHVGRWSRLGNGGILECAVLVVFVQFLKCGELDTLARVKEICGGLGSAFGRRLPDLHKIAHALIVDRDFGVDGALISDIILDLNFTCSHIPKLGRSHHTRSRSHQ
ncbi:hypothetical protein BC829DRAFT_390672, partial [Chytridium lagenaria]